MSMRGAAGIAVIGAAVVAAGVVIARRSVPRDPAAARRLARTEARLDAVCTLLSGIYIAEGIPVPAALGGDQRSALGRIRHLQLIRDAG